MCFGAIFQKLALARLLFDLNGRVYLCRVHRHHNGSHTHADTADNSSCIECSDAMSVDGLDDSANAEDQGSEGNRPAATKASRKGPDEET
jgi:hypothetical protein